MHSENVGTSKSVKIRHARIAITAVHKIKQKICLYDVFTRIRLSFLFAKSTESSCIISCELSQKKSFSCKLICSCFITFFFDLISTL